MPDISMCLNDKCSKCNGCYRFTAPPNRGGQAYDTFAPDPETNICEYYWPLPDTIDSINMFTSVERGKFDLGNGVVIEASFYEGGKL